MMEGRPFLVVATGTFPITQEFPCGVCLATYCCSNTEHALR
jgi:hypothetical protein